MTTTLTHRLPDDGLSSARLWLRRPVAEDCDALVAGIGDWDVARMLGRVPYPYGLADARRWIGSANATPDRADLVVVLAGALIGGVAFSGLPRIQQFGYWLARPFWGNGYATEAAGALLAYCFDRLGATEVSSGVFADNEASLNVQRKLGFRIVGQHRMLCLARGEEVTHIDTQLTRDRFIRQA
jgi:RimJ/RimL family protein N-acetyltransferase